MITATEIAAEVEAKSKFKVCPWIRDMCAGVNCMAWDNSEGQCLIRRWYYLEISMKQNVMAKGRVR